MLHNLTDKNFDEEIAKGLKLVIFHAKWCGYCHKQIPIISDLSKDIWIGEVDEAQAPQLIQKYGINSYPTFILFKDGKVVIEFSGFHQKYDLLNKLMGYVF